MQAENSVERSRASHANEAHPADAAATAGGDEIVTAKREVRAAALAARDAIAPEARAAKSHAICTQLAALFDEAVAAHDAAADADGGAAAGETGRARLTVAVYAAMKSEVDLGEFISHAYARKARVAFPCMNRDRSCGPMCMRLVSKQALAAGRVPFVNSLLKRFGDGDEAVADFPAVAPERIDMVVVPMVAFDDTLARLGYGGGNYDEFLARLRPDAVVVGAAFEEQQVAHVPREPHDLALPRIVCA